MRIIKYKSIPLSIILSIITCGIYGLIWMANLADDMNSLTNDQNGTSGGMVVLLSIVTCNIYAIYWYYKMGEKADLVAGKRDGSSSIVYLLLGIFGLGIINYCLMQDVINKNANVA